MRAREHTRCAPARGMFHILPHPRHSRVGGNLAYPAPILPRLMYTPTGTAPTITTKRSAAMIPTVFDPPSSASGASGAGVEVATAWVTAVAGGTGVNVAAGIGVAVAGTDVAAGTGVAVGTGVSVGANVAVGIGVAVAGLGVAVAVGTNVAVGLGVAVAGLGVAVGTAVGVNVAVGTGVAVAGTALPTSTGDAKTSLPTRISYAPSMAAVKGRSTVIVSCAPIGYSATRSICPFTHRFAKYTPGSSV